MRATNGVHEGEWAGGQGGRARRRMTMMLVLLLMRMRMRAEMGMLLLPGLKFECKCEITARSFEHGARCDGV
jgi:hypothetical protein